MDCAVVAENLVAYHVGGVDDDVARAAIEEHLVVCRSCIETYLAIKRAADRAALERPRPEVRARLRAEVVHAFPPRRASARVTFLERRIPLYQGVALAAVAAAVALVAPSVRERFSEGVRSAERGPTPSSGHDKGAPIVDTARARAESLSIY